MKSKKIPLQWKKYVSTLEAFAADFTAAQKRVAAEEVDLYYKSHNKAKSETTGLEPNRKAFFVCQ